MNKPLFTQPAELVKFVQMLDKKVNDVIILTETEVRMNKKDVATKSVANTFIGATKVQKVKVAVNEDYEKRVNVMRYLERKDENFQAEGLAWGTCTDNIIVENKGKTYLKTIELEKIESAYHFDGKTIAYDALKPFIADRAPSAKQDLNQEVKVRTYAIDSIKELYVGDSLIYRKETV